MATLNVNLPDPMKNFVDREVSSGRFRDASTYVQLLIAEATEAKETEFSEREKVRINQMLLESLDTFERDGGQAPVPAGKFAELAQVLIEKHIGKQAS